MIHNELGRLRYLSMMDTLNQLNLILIHLMQLVVLTQKHILQKKDVLMN
jgi:hypothetical protein